MKEYSENKLSKDKFIKLNSNIKYLKLGEDIGIKNLGYLMQLIYGMSYNNKIYFEKLNISKRSISRLRKILKDNNIIKKTKDGYFINPKYAYYGKKINNSLKEIYE